MMKDMESSPSIGSGNVPKPPITLRLIVPASQCGSLIGKGGSKIKEIREVTGASIQVASEMLPNSTERAVTVSGASEAIELCIQHICAIMIESPPKGATIPYRPKPCTSTTNTGPSMLMTAGAVPALQGNLAGITTPADVGKLLSLGLGTSLGLTQADWRMTGLMDIAANLGTLNSFRPQDHNRGSANQQTHEMTVPNELIGCIIGKGGSKISEIRQLSGAMIRISNCEDVEGGKTDRTIIISGSGDAVALAQYLINASIDLQKAQTGPQPDGCSSSSSTETTTGATSTTATTGSGSDASAEPKPGLSSLPVSLTKVLGSSPTLLATLLNLGSAPSGANVLANALSVALLSCIRRGPYGAGGGGGGRDSYRGNPSNRLHRNERNRLNPY
ncbi:unnamed protein product [Notodromas monacha]|uniref:K Homology domain-containing protein n=1 Tax=Notodromas monacha TaxID=399045 RepID=A0A7R9BZU7_9CRUS|nr:unnamed protein product [Notodromas monacha]CAG0923543.1 unnamed protein product [Notodromas monacha]